MTVAAAEEHSRLVAVCGGLASEPAAVPVLIGLGVRELSVVPTLVPQLKSLIRTLTLDACRSLAQQRARARHGRGGARAGQRILRLANRGWRHEERRRRSAADRPRADAADRGAARRRAAAAPRAARPARHCRRSRRPAMRSSPTSACCSRSASPSASRARITAPPDSRASSAISSRPRAPKC